MNKIIASLLLVCSVALAHATTPVWDERGYNITVDLKKVKKDKVKVIIDLTLLDLSGNAFEYVMPKVIPGSYSVKDFGRFVSDFEVRDAKNKKLDWAKEGNNVWQIQGIPATISYWVDDTWDAPDDNFIFQPGGTNIQKDTNFVINHQGFYGYIEGHSLNPYRIEYIRPKGLLCTTALTITSLKKSDVVTADTYVKLVDNPVMYSKADTVSFMAGNMKVNISVHSYPKLVTAKQVQGYIKPLGAALEIFFGGQLPVNEYTFIMHFPMFSDEECRYGGFGALEHSYCSMYFLPYLDDDERMQSMIYGVAAHEFLHILTPLNIHSEEIETFDFRDPDMSQHLWMYEGVTEYFANLVQVQADLISLEDFMFEMDAKIERAVEYGDVSFTEMSEFILTDEYKEMYSNVYEKGALIGLMLDIRLNELSGGEMGVRELMLLLAGQYGPSKPFNDEDLVNDIIALTYPEIADFFAAHVVGDTPLPMQEYFAKIGWGYYPEKEVSHYTFGIKQFILTEEGGIGVYSIDRRYNTLGLEKHDEILSINEEAVTPETTEVAFEIYESYEQKEVEVVVLREGREVTLTGKSVEITALEEFVLEPLENPTPEQQQLLEWVLGI